MESLITGIAVTIILPIVYGLFFYLKEKEEKKITYGSEFTVKMSKCFMVFFLICMIICFFGMVGAVILLIAIDEPNKFTIFWTLELVSLAFFLLGAFGFFSCKYDYIVVKEDGIIVNKMFKKQRIIKYSDITYITSHSYGFGEVACYDSNGIPLLSVDYYHVGVEKLDSILKSKGYELLSRPYPSEDMKKNDKFKKYKKKSSLKIGFWCFLVFGLTLIGLGILVNALSDFHEYEKYKVSGVIENYKIDKETLKIKLENDSKEYYINNIVYDDLNEELYSVMNEGDSITLFVSYVDVYERYNICQIELNNTIYLDMELAEKREYSNYRTGIVGSYVMIGIGGALLVLSIVNFVKLKKLDSVKKD